MVATVPPKPRGIQASAGAARIREIFSRFAARNPHPQGELEYLNPFTLLVAVVLSAQATDSGVNRATRALFAEADTPEKMLALGEDAVREKIKTIGLFRAKAKNVIELSRHSSTISAARFRTRAKSCRACPASAARPPMSC